jgi:3'(2'), 5'-bisphosphate nucleotidase
MSKISIEELVKPSIKAALKAGQEIMHVYENEDFNIEFKDDNSPLTVADKRAHDIICTELENTEIPVLSEESKAIHFEERKNWEVFWLVDPLDGTKEFIKRNGEFTVNIALMINKKPVLGIIYAPVLKKLYYGYQNNAFLVNELDFSMNEAELLAQIDQKSISLPIENLKDKYTVVASRSHMSDETKEYIESLKKEKGQIEIRSIGSSLKLCLVAEGSADVYPRFGPTMEWDIGAGHAIIEASGAQLTQTDGIAPLNYNKENLLNPWFIVNKK